MQKKVIIIGGGVAGLTAASALVSRGVEVELFESRPFLGGRIYSFTDPETGDFVDNGQHVFAGFYYETFKFLSLIGSSEHIARQERLEIDFVEKGGGSFKFKCPRLPSPLHLLAGLIRYSEFPNKDIWNLVKNRKFMKSDVSGLSAAEFLKMLGQSERAIYSFFNPLVLATLNADLYEVSAELFRKTLNQIFTVPASHSVLAYATVGFSELIADPAKRYIEKNSGEVHLSCPIKNIHTTGDKVNGIVDETGAEHRADEYIFALPPDALSKILMSGSIPGLEKWSCSPIVSVNIWYDRSVMDQLMVGLLDGNFHWCFDKTSIIKEERHHCYVTLLASSAYDKIGCTREEIIQAALKDMNEYFPRSRSAEVLRAQVIKERKATVLITPRMRGLRPHESSPWKNMYLTGDWIDTGLPATVESAVKSGFRAADMVMASMS